MIQAFVRFRSHDSSYIIPVEVVKEVVSVSEIMPLPVPRPGVAGLMQRGKDVITVLSALGEGDDRVIVVIDAEGVLFGLITEEVMGIVRYEQTAIEAAPPGQDEALVEGLMVLPDHVDMLVSPARVWNLYGAE